MAGEKVLLVFNFPHHPGPVYFRRFREVGAGRRGGVPKTEAEFDDDVRQSVWYTPEQAVQMREFFRGQGYKVAIQDREGHGPLFERNDSPAISQTERFAGFESKFVPLQGGGYDGRNLGFIVKRNPQKGWFIRALDVPSMRAEHRDRETLWSSESAEAVVTKLIEAWTLAVAVPYEDPQVAQRAEQERQSASRQVSQLPTGVRARPGSR